MSKYKSPTGGSGKRTTNLFYRSGINSLLSRIEKLEHSVNCCNLDKDTMYTLAGSTSLVRKTHNHNTILWDCSADDALLQLWYGTKGDTCTVILNADAHADGGGIGSSSGAQGSFWGTLSLIIAGATADESRAQQVASDATAANFDFIILDDNGTATGGQAGNRLHFVCTTNGQWHVDGQLTTAGVPGTVAPITSAIA